MVSIEYVLRACYFLAMATCALKAGRYLADSRRKEQWFYLLGTPANIALFVAIAMILVDMGDEPKIRGEWARVVVRTSFMSWAVLSILFELLYIATFVIIRKKK